MLGAKGLPGSSGSGGIERGVSEVARRLVAKGHEVIVYERARSYGTRIEHGIRVRSVPFLDRKTLAGWSHVALSVIDSLLRHREVTVYHLHGAQNGFFCLPLRLTGARVVFHLHGAEWRARKWGKMMSRLFRCSCAFGALGAHEVGSVCTRGVMAIRRLPGTARKTWLIPNGMPHHRRQFQPISAAPIEERPFLLYVGRVVPQKRLELLIEAFTRIDSNAQLLIAGPTSHTDSYLASLKNSSHENPRIIFLGALDHESVSNLYQRCLALVLPSEAEGCSNVLLEGLSFGCCIVTSDIAENLAVVGNAAAIFKSGDLNALTQTLSRVMTDKAKVDRLRSAALVRAAELADWDIVTENFLRLYTGGSQDGHGPGAHPKEISWLQREKAPISPGCPAIEQSTGPFAD